MDYSPSPARVSGQYAFLDNSIELGRAERTKISPLKTQQSRDESLNNLQRRFYSKYSEFRPQSAEQGKPYKKATLDETTDRLFKNIPEANVPVDKGVQISSNMVEKIIRENERLKGEIERSTEDKELAQRFARGLKEKLLKYRQQNETLKQDLDHANSRIKVLEEDRASLKRNLATLQLDFGKLEKQIRQQQQQQQEQQESTPQLAFDPENTRDIFGTPIKTLPLDETTISDPSEPVQSASKIEARIKSLEDQVVQIKDNDDERFKYIKDEMQFLKALLSSQQEEQENNIPTPPVSRRPSVPVVEKHLETVINEDDWVIRESVELENLQNEVSRVQHKIQLREENNKKKSALVKQLKELSFKLECQDGTTYDDLPQKQADKQEKHESEQQQQQQQQKQKPQPQTLAKECGVCPSSFTSKETTPVQVVGGLGSEEQPHFHINGTKWY